MMKNLFLSSVAAGLLLLASPTPVFAQITDHIYQSDRTVDSLKQGSLYLEVDNITFFKNDELSGNFLKGYTLPGFWIQPKAVYYPLKNLKLELGIHALRFWGAEKYPTFAYSDIANWKGDQYTRGFHLLPWVRAHLQVNEHFSFILGSIYGAGNHRLIEPLYNPEMNLMADPENGFQLLYNSQAVDFDVWLNWDSFIYKNSHHQESFTVGISSRFKYNSPDAKVHFYTPFQLLGQHRGGEIDDSENDLQMLYNAATGIAAVWNADCGAFKRLEGGINAAAFYMQKGDVVPFKKGYGLYAYSHADIGSFRVKASYWMCKNFMSVLGSPMYGSVSTENDNYYFDRPKNAYLGGEYFRQLGKGYSLGVDFDVYFHFPADVSTAEGTIHQGSANSFTMGVYFRLNPSFLLKKFR